MQQILIVLQMLFGINNVVVFIDVVYYCVKVCGICDVISVIIIIFFGGLFKFSQNICQEFLCVVCYYN